MSMQTVRSSQRGPPAGLLVAVLLGVLLPAEALGAEMRQGDMVTVDPGEVIDEDLYAFGGTVLIQGTVHGDVIAFAGTVDISGTVDGDVVAAAGNTRISGQVQGSIRAAAGTLILTGKTGEDGVLAGGQVRLEPGAKIGGDLILAATEGRVLAPVGGEVQAAANKLTLGAPVEGDVHAEVGTLQLTNEAHIGGSLRYRGARDAELASGATVAGPVEKLSPAEHRGRGPLMYVYGWFRSLVGLFALGVLLVFLTPDFARRVPATLRQTPGKSLGWGALILFGMPMVAALFFVVGALLGGWWLGLFCLGIYALALALCFPVMGMFLGRWLLARFGKTGKSLVLTLLLGLALLTLVIRVPVLGGLVAIVTMLFGLGALAITALQRRRPAGGLAQPQAA